MSRANVTVSAIRPPALTRALASSETGRAGSQGLRNVAGAEATERPRTISGMSDHPSLKIPLLSCLPQPVVGEVSTASEQSCGYHSSIARALARGCVRGGNCDPAQAASSLPDKVEALDCVTEGLRRLIKAVISPAVAVIRPATAVMIAAALLPPDGASAPAAGGVDWGGAEFDCGPEPTGCDDCAGVECGGVECGGVECGGVECVGVECGGVACVDVDCAGVDCGGGPEPCGPGARTKRPTNVMITPTSSARSPSRIQRSRPRR
jgi:hypothetical protein